MNKIQKSNKTSIKGITAEKSTVADNFADINDLTRQYFLLMMNVLESPFLMSFLSHHEYNDKKTLKLKTTRKSKEIELKPENRWKVETTPYTRALLTDGAIIYKWSWKQIKKSSIGVSSLLRPFFEIAVGKLIKDDLNFQMAIIIEVMIKALLSTGSKLEGKKQIEEELYKLISGKFNEDIAGLINKDVDIVLSKGKHNAIYELIFGSVENKSVEEDSFKDINDKIKLFITKLDEELDKSTNLAQFSGKLTVDFLKDMGRSCKYEGSISLMEDLTKKSIKRLKNQEVNIDLSVVFKALGGYSEGGKNKIIKSSIISTFRSFLEEENEMNFVVPHIPQSKKKMAMDFDVVTFIGKVFYEVSSLIEELIHLRKISKRNNEEEQRLDFLKNKLKDALEEYGSKLDCHEILDELEKWEFNLIASRKMNGCGWKVPQSTIIRLDPNLLWPKLDIEYSEGKDQEKKDYILKIENIANGIKWRKFEVQKGNLRKSGNSEKSELVFENNVNNIDLSLDSQNDVNINNIDLSLDSLNSRMYFYTTDGEEINISDIQDVKKELGDEKLEVKWLKPSSDFDIEKAYLMSESVHEYGQTKATLNLNDFFNDENDSRTATKKVITFPYICGSFDLLTEIQFGKDGDDENNLLMFTT